MSAETRDFILHLQEQLTALEENRHSPREPNLIYIPNDAIYTLAMIVLEQNERIAELERLLKDDGK